MLSKEEIVNRSVRFKEPKISGVYFLVSVHNRIIYVGSSMDLHGRLLSHRKNLNLHFCKWFFIKVEDKQEMLALEKAYIEKLKPKFNLKHNPILAEENNLAISLMNEKEKQYFESRNTTGFISIDQITEILERNGIQSKLKKACIW